MENNEFDWGRNEKQTMARAWLAKTMAPFQRTAIRYFKRSVQAGERSLKAGYASEKLFRTTIKKLIQPIPNVKS